MTDSRIPPRPEARDNGRSSSDSPREESPELRRALGRLVAGALGSASEADLDAAAKAVCATAREQRMPIERVLITLHAAWDDADRSRAPRSERREAVRVRLVSRCIRAFYGSQS